MRKNGVHRIRLTAAVLLAAATLSLFSGCGLIGKKRKDNSKATETALRAIALTEFTGETDAMVVNDTEDIVFTVKGSEAGRRNISIVVNESNVGPMTDDGVAPDKTAGDGIYTASVTIRSDDYAETLKICAASGSYRSDIFLLHIYEMPTAEEAAKADELEKRLEQLEKSYDAGDGTVSMETVPELLQKAGEIAGKAQDAGVLKDYEVTEDAVEMEFVCGGLYIYKPEVRGLWNIGDGGSAEIFTLEPFPAALKSNGLKQHIDDAARSITEALPEYSFPDEREIDGKEVTLDALDEFSTRQLIIWEGHGDWNRKVHSYICTGENMSLFAALFDWDLFKQWIKKDIVMAGGKKAFTAKYVDKNLGSIEDSVVLLCCCRSGYDSTLADAFLNKGADAVIGFSEYVHMKYEMKLIDRFLAHLTETDPDTGLYYTFKEAMRLAGEEEGTDDGEYKIEEGITKGPYSIPSSPVIFGGDEAEELRLCEPQQDTAEPEEETDPEPASESETEELSAGLADGTYQLRIHKKNLVPYGGGYRTKAEKIENVTIPASRVKKLQKGDVLRVDGVGEFELLEVTPTWISLSEGNQLYPAEGGNEWILAWPNDVPYTTSAGIVEIYIPPEARIENWLSPEQSGEGEFRVEKSIAKLFEDPYVGTEETFTVIVQGGKIVCVVLPFHP